MLILRIDPGGRYPWNISEQFVQLRRHRRSSLHYGLKFRQLAHGAGALQFTHPVVQGEEVVVGLRIPIAPGLVDVKVHAPGQCRVVADDESTLTRRDVLALLQAEAADVAPGANIPSRVLGQEGLGTVLDYRDIV